MSIYVLDASAMVAYLAGERGAEVVEALLNDTNSLCYAHSLNLCEVFYDALRATNEPHAEQTIKDLYDAGVMERHDMSRDFWHSVGRLKARGRISLADCFGIALAQKLGGEIVTSDHHEFDPIVGLSIVSVRFIR
ncbi:MAG: type II toxin-antitoxin system VapC family toxin [Armatimonadetes bacterium]|nr:type II toxin-antitoxin system VapC family toxin [Armatimonadota bacterium]